jgi:hypothetical protein
MGIWGIGDFTAELLPPVGIIFATLAVGLAAKILVDDELPIPKLDVDHYCEQARSCEAVEQIYYDTLKSVWSSIPMSVRKCCVERNPNRDYMDLGACIGVFRNFGYYPMGNETSRCVSS